MNKSLVYWLAFCFLLISGHASAAKKVPVVWDGFAYPYKPGAPEKCDEKLNPSCAILFDKEYAKRFWDKVESINDNNYEFVSTSNEAGDSLHVAVSVGLEWIIKGSGSSDDEYYFCANIILYSATGNKLNLVNSKPNCWHQRLKAEDKADLRGFLQKFIFDTSKTAQTVEKRLLAEMSEIINTNNSDLIRLKLGAVTSSTDVFANEPAKKDLLNYYVAELFSSYASNALGRPIIPASTSTGLLDLRFAVTNRRSSISLPLATHIIDLHIYPFVKQSYLEQKKIKFERTAAFISLNHKSDVMDHQLRDVMFGLFSAPRRVIDELSDSDEMKNLILLDQLIEETSNQLAKPNKEWLKQHVVKNSLDKVLRGVEALSLDLKK